MSIQFRASDLSPAEVSFLKWQYGFDDNDEPFGRALWQAIGRAWEVDSASGTRHLDRLGCAGAYPEEVALYRRFRSADGERVWTDLIRRAGLSERRTTKATRKPERRHSSLKPDRPKAE